MSWSGVLYTARVYKGCICLIFLLNPAPPLELLALLNKCGSQMPSALLLLWCWLPSNPSLRLFNYSSLYSFVWLSLIFLVPLFTPFDASNLSNLDAYSCEISPPSTKQELLLNICCYLIILVFWMSWLLLAL